MLAKDSDITSPDTRDIVVCRYFQAGYCRRGSACQFNHPIGYRPEVHDLKRFPGHVHDPIPVYFPSTYSMPGSHTLYSSWHPYNPSFQPRSPPDIPAVPLTHNAILRHQEYPPDFSVVSEASSSASSNLSDQDSHTVYSRPTGISEHQLPLHAPYNQIPIGTHVGLYPNVSVIAQDTPQNILSNQLSYPEFRVQLQGTNSKRKPMAYKTKPCKFFTAQGTCVNGDMCTFIHGNPNKSKPEIHRVADVDVCESRPDLPAKPASVYEDAKARDYYPIPWRVVGGGVMMGGDRPRCKAYSTGYCKHGDDCKFAHEIDLETYSNGIVQLKSRKKKSSASQKALITQALVEISQPGVFRPLPVSRQRKKAEKQASVSHVITSPVGADSGRYSTTKQLDQNDTQVVTRDVVDAFESHSPHHRRSKSMTLPSSPVATSNVCLNAFLSLVELNTSVLLLQKFSAEL
ncbi:hypothetical protein BJ138DRAFT_433902 [Hygrophoropsis aurantiaca]|uniref:Uncharacterized protein n=1 Tax=Hygrophoropsis aurantiaca TaxID=72124 RepID=A0ACB8ANE0_9AGAM|nr:hypothetical protein BJ138DRAFT_433902 [Hygrophoropsis aurantiaca]